MDSTAPPPGFEGVEQHQRIRVSLYFMNQYLGFSYINIQEGRLRFEQPEQVLKKLSKVKNKKKILTFLKQSLALNLGCHSKKNAGLTRCQRLKQEALYLIYKPKREAIYLYLKTTYFKKPSAKHQIYFLANPSAGWSYLNKLGAAASFSQDNAPIASYLYPIMPNYYNIYSNNTLAYQNTSLIANLSQNNGISHGQYFQFQSLFAQQINLDKIYAGGYIVNPSSPFFQTQTILGLGVKTTLDTLKDAELITASTLVIFVPQAAQVNIFKNGQLIFSQFLEAGYQAINTSAFPNGGYELLIKIGSNLILHRFFSKGSSLPPPELPQFYLLGGYLSNEMIVLNNCYSVFPRLLNVPMIQTGINARKSARMALFTDLLINSQQILLDFGSTFFLGNTWIRTAGLISTKNNYGLYAMLNTQRNKFNFNLIATKIVYQNQTPNYYFLNNLIDNDSVSLGYQLSPYSLLGIQANYTKTLDQINTYSSGAFYQHYLGNFYGMTFFFNAVFNRTIDVGNTYNLSLSMNFSQGSFAGTESLLLQNQNKNTPFNQATRPVVLQGSTVYSQQNEFGLGHAFNEIHSFSPAASSVASTYNYTAPQGFLATYANFNQAQGRGSLGYGGNFETEFAFSQGDFSFNGIQRSNSAGMIIRVESSEKLYDKNARFALLDGNNRKVALIRANKKAFISLPGFTEQDYTLVNLSKTDYFIKNPSRHIILYPGNVGHYRWRVERRLIVMGRVLQSISKEPLTNTWIHAGKNGIFTDSEGNFQLELAQKTKLLRSDENNCQIQLPALNTEQAYFYLGEILCTPPNS